MKRSDLKDGDVFRYADEDYGSARYKGALSPACPIEALPTVDNGTPEDDTAEVVLLWRPGVYPPKPDKTEW